MSRQGALRRRERLCETPVLLIACAFAQYHVQRNIVRLARQLLDAPAFIADSDCNRTRLQSGKGAVIITAAVAEPHARCSPPAAPRCAPTPAATNAESRRAHRIRRPLASKKPRSAAHIQ